MADETPGVPPPEEPPKDPARMTGRELFDALLDLHGWKEPPADGPATYADEVMAEFALRMIKADDEAAEGQKRMLNSFARCAGAVLASLWAAHNGRDLTDAEAGRLGGLLFDFFLTIK